MSVQPRRIRLKPWLLAQVNGGHYPGLQWLSEEQRFFQIPWRHATRHMPIPSSSSYRCFTCLPHANLLITGFVYFHRRHQAWALETGKYQEGVDEPDPAKWKANLRCALNKSREFKLRYDGTKETPVKPYKVYEVCDQPSNGDTVDEEEEELPNLVGLTIDPRTSEVPVFLNYLNIPMPLPPDGLPAMKMEQKFPGAQLQMAGDGEPADFGHVANGLAGATLAVPPLRPSPAAASMAPPPGATGMDTGPDPMDTGPMPGMQTLPLTDLDLKFQYRGRTARSQTVSNPQGCRLYYGHLEPTPGQVELFGPVSLQQVLFPGTADVQNQKQRFYTEALLDVMDRGLILEIWEQDIYAVRLCQCKVFWSGPEVSEHGPPNPMEREKKIRVFSLNQFLEGLIGYHKGDAPSPPPFEVYFCFGEDWPDKKPKEKKLIVVQVVPVVARILTEMFSGELSWSMDSIRLQISNPDVKDRTVEQFKEIQRLLQQGPWGSQGP
ncbi:hypothetical protein NHX12_020306 [Muraenolepis orangiensis]|uniref:IRF tryptophan pentad repeat domain-containing protein n=1 Tax=Muraenolepis orangiensis TaxID=630683 RepID=A0A9Q0ER80_9TELE|nr:hypothetical protein NHX12_020306 [Muraenolepis orangiensis]